MPAITAHPRFHIAVYERNTVDWLLPAWRSLYQRIGAWSPFSDPEYQLAWCGEFVREGHERIVGVWSTETAELVGVLPLFEASAGVGATRVRALHVFGALYEPLLHELPEILVDPACARPALAAAVAWLVEHAEWDWIELPLREDQPWFEARWASDAGLAGATVMHRQPIPLVTVELPPGEERLRLKRNLKESLRRTRNRANRELQGWATTRSTPADLDWPDALANLKRLHSQRAEISGRPSHRDVFGGTRQARLLDRLKPTACGTHPAIYRFDHGGATLAVLLTLNSQTTTWITVSGVAPQYWHLGAVTLLQSQAAEESQASGRTTAAFAPGVDTAKLRWSETVRVSQMFALVRPRRRSALAFRAYWVAAAARAVVRETHA